MKKIVLSVDGPLHLCLVPDDVSDNLYEYICDFDDYVRENKMIQISELEYRLTIQEIPGFIEWLNERFNEQSKILEVIEDKNYKKYEDLPSWNW